MSLTIVGVGEGKVEFSVSTMYTNALEQSRSGESNSLQLVKKL